MRIPYNEAVNTMERALRKYLDGGNARVLAEIFARNTREGVYSHGINRFPRFFRSLASGSTNARVTESERIGGLGGLEARDAHFGVGPLIADQAMARAISLAQTHGIACVGVRNNNHWLRAGRYGLMAAEAGMIGICFTNTMANMPAWGAKAACVGNNPLCIAVPYADGPILLDMAASQFSYGKLELAALQGKQLPIEGGYDDAGNLTRDPAAILRSGRTLPIGYWKGSALSILLDLASSSVSMGRTVQMLSRDAGDERGVSQVFIAINYRAVTDAAQVEANIEDTVRAIKAAEPAQPGVSVRVPGQNLKAISQENGLLGLPVDDSTWSAVVKYAEA
jgi:3-dehydro-L-gulonate 2-dehydrogenase